MPRLEERGAIGVNGPALFRADHILRYALSGNARGIGKSIRIEQGQDAVESIGLSLVRCCRQQQEIRSSFGKSPAQLHSRHLVRAAAQPVRLIHNDQIPTRRTATSPAGPVLPPRRAASPTMTTPHPAATRLSSRSRLWMRRTGWAAAR